MVVRQSIEVFLDIFHTRARETPCNNPDDVLTMRNRTKFISSTALKVGTIGTILVTCLSEPLVRFKDNREATKYLVKIFKRMNLRKKTLVLSLDNVIAPHH